MYLGETEDSGQMIKFPLCWNGPCTCYTRSLIPWDKNKGRPRGRQLCSQQLTSSFDVAQYFQ